MYTKYLNITVNWPSHQTEEATRPVAKRHVNDKRPTGKRKHNYEWEDSAKIGNKNK